jgi:hypothetical protein
MAVFPIGPDLFIEHSCDYSLASKGKLMLIPKVKLYEFPLSDGTDYYTLTWL